MYICGFTVKVQGLELEAVNLLIKSGRLKWFGHVGHIEDDADLLCGIDLLVWLVHM